MKRLNEILIPSGPQPGHAGGDIRALRRYYGKDFNRLKSCRILILSAGNGVVEGVVSAPQSVPLAQTISSPGA